MHKIVKLTKGYIVVYDEITNHMGGYHPVNLWLCHEETDMYVRLTDEDGAFLAFPGIKDGPWKEQYKGRRIPEQMRFRLRIGEPESEQALFRLDWEIQPDGRYWMDEDGFGMEDDEEIWLCADINEEGRFIMPFH